MKTSYELHELWCKFRAIARFDISPQKGIERADKMRPIAVVLIALIMIALIVGVLELRKEQAKKTAVQAAQETEGLTFKKREDSCAAHVIKLTDKLAAAQSALEKLKETEAGNNLLYAAQEDSQMAHISLEEEEVNTSETFHSATRDEITKMKLRLIEEKYAAKRAKLNKELAGLQRLQAAKQNTEEARGKQRAAFEWFHSFTLQRNEHRMSEKDLETCLSF
jgi:hypothetical protein